MIRFLTLFQKEINSQNNKKVTIVTAIHAHAWITVWNTHEFRDKGATVCLRKVLKLDRDLDRENKSRFKFNFSTKFKI